MFIDARTVSRDATVEADICIIGAGAAGISMALEFAGGPHRIALLESGDLELDPMTQSLYKGEVVGQPYAPLDSVRLRYFGGTTNHWAGWCWPLDASDFEERSWIPDSGWPLSRKELDPYYRQAQSVCELGPYRYDIAFWTSEKLKAFPLNTNNIAQKAIQFSPPTRFGSEYRSEVKRAANITTYLNANVVDIETDENARQVKRVQIACLTGNRFSLKAKIFVLATGGIENARLLLQSNSAQSEGLGNANDLVGRYFADHIELLGSVILLFDPNIDTSLYINPPEDRARKFQGALCLPYKVQRREQLANYAGILIAGAWSDLISEDSFFEAVGTVAGNIGVLLTSQYRKYFAPDERRKLALLWSLIEPVPNPNSRVTLSADQKNALGQNIARLNWRLSETDKQTCRRAEELLNIELSRSGVGRLMKAVDFESGWPDTMQPGWHHMGTTRMHTDPKRGVVNADCRVHGVANLYLAGSSVFPTYGSTNPTFTIVALAIRLARYLKKVI